MATKTPDRRSEFLCPKCKNWLNEPRVGKCGHNYCTSCLEAILNEIPLGADEVPGEGIMFQCPQEDCGKPKYLIPSASIEHFPPNIYLKNEVEKVKMRETEAICAEHQQPYIRFCKETTCMCEICIDCIDNHQKHETIKKELAIKEYVDKYRNVSEKINAELEGIKGSKKELRALINAEKCKLAASVGKLFEVFTSTETRMAIEQVECITKALQEFEFKSPSKTQLELERRATTLRYIQRIGRPILAKTCKNVKEPMIMLEGATNEMDTLKEKTKKQLQMKMKAPLEEFTVLKHGYLCRLSENFRLGVFYENK